MIAEYPDMISRMSFFALQQTNAISSGYPDNISPAIPINPEA